MTKLVTCTICNETMDSDDIIEHGTTKHNHYIAKILKVKLDELRVMTGNKNLKISDVMPDKMLKAYLELSWAIRAQDR